MIEIKKYTKAINLDFLTKCMRFATERDLAICMKESTKKYAVLADGLCIGVYGCISDLNSSALLWLIGTPLLNQYPFEFAKKTKSHFINFTGKMKEKRVISYVDFSDPSAKINQRFLYFLGFEGLVDGDELDGLKYHRYYIWERNGSN